MTETGSIQVRVVTSRAQIPLEGATVLITRRGKSGKHALISIQRADESGNVGNVTLAAPDMEQSTEPGSDTPFTHVDVWVEHPGYEIVRIEGAQIFPDQASILQIALNPAVAGLGWTQEGNVRVITPQDL